MHYDLMDESQIIINKKFRIKDLKDQTFTLLTLKKVLLKLDEGKV